METTTNSYVTVGPADRNRGWNVCFRNGNVITHLRLNAPTAKPEEARAEAAAMFPGKTVYMRGDKVKPWERAA